MTINKKYRASMTIELTLLMPLIIGVFLFLFFTLYYLHDIVAVNKGICTALLRGSLATEEDFAEEIMEDALSDIRLLGKWDSDRKCDCSEDEVKVDFAGRMEATEGLFRKLISGEYAYETFGSSKRIDEVEYIRNRRK